MTAADTHEADSQPDEPTARMLTWARNSTLYRLSRQMLTEKQLSDAIRRKAKEKFDPIAAPTLQALADYAVAFAYEQNALDDKNYASVSTRSGVRNGKSRRMIAQKLATKGVAAETVETAMVETNDLVAAVIFARKRRFGPYRTVELDDKRKLKELSAFARNGFSFEIGKKVFDMDHDEANDVLFNTPT